MNCQLDWTSHEYSLQVNSINLTSLSFELKAPPKKTPKPSPLNKASTSKSMQCPDKSVYWIQDVENPTHGWEAKKTSLHNQGYGRGESSTQQCWVPKATYASLPAHLQQKYLFDAKPKPTTNSIKPNPPKQTAKPPAKQVWIPKGQKLPTTLKTPP